MNEGALGLPLGGKSDLLLRTLQTGRWERVITYGVALNNWHPCDLDTVSVLAIYDTVSDSCQITGLRAGRHGQTIMLLNARMAGQKTIQLVHESTSSQPRNRFALPGNDRLAIRNGEYALLVYDEQTTLDAPSSVDRLTAGRWRAMTSADKTIHPVSMTLGFENLGYLGSSTAFGAAAPTWLMSDDWLLIRPTGNLAVHSLSPSAGGVLATSVKQIIITNMPSVADGPGGIRRLGDFNITFKHASDWRAATTGAGQIQTPGGRDFVLRPHESVMAYYSLSVNRWIILGQARVPGFEIPPQVFPGTGKSSAMGAF